MNPHFLYNVLQSISSLAMLDKVSEIITVSNSLGNTLRYCINSRQPLAPLRDEIAHVTEGVRKGPDRCKEASMK